MTLASWGKQRAASGFLCLPLSLYAFKKPWFVLTKDGWGLSVRHGPVRVAESLSVTVYPALQT